MSPGWTGFVVGVVCGWFLAFLAYGFAFPGSKR